MSLTINNILATTELEAVNTMLAVIGESPLATGTDLASVTLPDVVSAIQILRTATREIQTKKWRFNTEFGYTIQPTATQSLGGVSCNIFVAPGNLASFEVSRNAAQAGLDVTIRPSAVYSPAGTLVFYDRLSNREGLTAATYATLKIDPVWFLDFTTLPEVARRYITILAARRLQQSVVGSTELDGFTKEDEQAALAALEQEQRLGFPVIAEGTPETVTQALNLILASAGMEPVASADAPQNDKAAVALNTIRTAMREVQRNGGKGWRFNTEIGYQIAKTATVSWVDTAGVTTALNVFKAPANLAAFEITKSQDQQGSNYTDVALMQSRQYTETGSPVQVFYDRANNRDGFTHTYLYINPVWYISFDNMPETARWYVTVLAMRRFTSRVTGTTTLTDRDELMARRDLQDDQGDVDDFNVFNQYDVSRTLGGRRFGPSGMAEFRNTPNKA